MEIIENLRVWQFLAMALFSDINDTIAQEKSNQMNQDFSTEIQFDYRYFLNKGLYEGQKSHFLSISIQPEYELDWEDGNQNLKVTLFGRWDQHDQNRTHFDIRELYYQKVKGDWELSIGAKKIFWGVTESNHLVDIINQTDQVESFDGEQKLGQPMVHFSIFKNFGTFDLFYMPYARKRQFPAENGRLRFPVVIERDDLPVDSDLKQWYPSFAARWSHYFGPMDIGVSNFYGVGREPLFLDIASENPQIFYPIINQTGVELQAITGVFLWKVEGIYRYAEQQDFVALTAGFEYTFGNIASTGLDIGIISEYLYDSRDELALSSLDNDIFVGSRFALNDAQSTALLIGAIFDLEHSTRLYSIEGSRRLGNSWKVELEGRFFQNISEREFLYFFREDSFLQFRLAKFF
ncbi:MAG: hypothetical protein KTR26_08140 [Flammeovirgaceae bacterium]|nr:hypothetical protein [Flammeovirgaceae bacterium]